MTTTSKALDQLRTDEAPPPNGTGPGALVAQHREDFATVLPSHIKPETWTRVAVGALRRDKKLAHAAANNPAALMVALLDAARLGLEPGTEQYYLTPRRVKSQSGKYQDEILGIVGYQGQIELMYRAGAVASVVAECVYRADGFRYQPGVDERPHHDIDWDADDRGPLRLVYAYAIMKDGATSKVVVLNRAAIDAIKKSSSGASSEYSPWVQHEAAMWLKSAVHQLSKWVPTSAEYREAMIRDAVAIQQARADNPTPPPLVAPVDVPPGVDPDTGEVVQAELVDDPRDPS